MSLRLFTKQADKFKGVVFHWVLPPFNWGSFGRIKMNMGHVHSFTKNPVRANVLAKCTHFGGYSKDYTIIRANQTTGRE